MYVYYKNRKLDFCITQKIPLLLSIRNALNCPRIEFRRFLNRGHYQHALAIQVRFLRLLLPKCLFLIRKRPRLEALKKRSRRIASSHIQTESALTFFP